MILRNELNNLPKMENYLFKENKLIGYSRDTYFIKTLAEPTKEFALNSVCFKQLEMLNNDNIELELCDGYVKAIAGKKKLKLNILASDFRENNFETTFTQVVNVAKLKKALKFVDKKGNRPILMGVNISATHIVATDSFKLYFSGEYDSNSVTLPSEFVNALVGDNVLIECNDKMCKATMQEYVLCSNLLAGVYPNVSKLISLNALSTYEFTSDMVEPIVEAQKLLKVNPDNRYLKFSVENNKLNISNDTYDNDICDLKGDNMTIYLALDYIDLLNEFDNFQVYYNGEKRPFILNKENEIILLLPLSI